MNNDHLGLAEAKGFIADLMSIVTARQVHLGQEVRDPDQPAPDNYFITEVYTAQNLYMAQANITYANAEFILQVHGLLALQIHVDQVEIDTYNTLVALTPLSIVQIRDWVLYTNPIVIILLRILDRMRAAATNFPIIGLLQHLTPFMQDPDRFELQFRTFYYYWREAGLEQFFGLSDWTLDGCSEAQRDTYIAYATSVVLNTDPAFSNYAYIHRRR